MSKYVQVKLVLDTNIIVSSVISQRGYSAKIRGKWQSGEVQLATSREILQEVEWVLNYPRIQKRHRWTPKQVSEFVKQIRANSVFVAKTRKVKAVEEDPDDDKFIECALAAKARIIITGDPHLLSIKKYKNISIVTPREFIESRG